MSDKLKEMCRDYWAVKDQRITWDELLEQRGNPKFPGAERIVRQIEEGMRVVLRKHVQPMLADAMQEGIVQRAKAKPPNYGTENPTHYAARIIDELEKRNAPK